MLCLGGNDLSRRRGDQASLVRSLSYLDMPVHGLLPIPSIRVRLNLIFLSVM